MQRVDSLWGKQVGRLAAIQTPAVSLGIINSSATIVAIVNSSKF
jgi:hypothetical protein